MAARFDPDSPAEGGLYGLPVEPRDARVVVLPVPYEATTSSGHGTSGGPAAVLEASHQVDLCSPATGQHWQHGLAMLPAPKAVVEVAAEALQAAECARDASRPDLERDRARARVNEASLQVQLAVHSTVSDLLDAGQIPAVLGGDHSVPLGAIAAAVKHCPGMGILHVDAHADLREAYEGFEQSHASILHNVLKLQALGPVVQVGIRDFGMREHARFTSDPQLHTWTDEAISDAMAEGATWMSLVHRMLEPLPQQVWITFDVDGLDPSLCPTTGTPVPGGLSWNQARQLLNAVARSGRTVVGFDLCEVSGQPWDATVGARLLYHLAGVAVVSQLEGAP